MSDDSQEHVRPEQDNQAKPDDSPKWFDENWTKVHPLSPLVRGWVTIVAIPVAIFGYNWELVSDLWEAYRSGELMETLNENPVQSLLIGLGALGVILLIFGGFVLTWWFTRYQITEEHVMVKSGIFVRQHRQARIDRVQAVDLRQPLLARITGLAELKFEVAEGDGTAATLAFLKKAHAEEIRADIMDRASGRGRSAQRQQGAQSEAPTEAAPIDEVHAGQAAVSPSAGSAQGPGGHSDTAEGMAGHAQGHPPAEYPQPQHPQAPPPYDGRLITRVPTGRLIGSVVMGWGTVTLVFIILLIGTGSLIGFLITGGDGADLETPADFLREFWPFFLAGAALPALLPGAIAVLTIYYQQLSGGFRFTATMTEAGLRMRYGLLETTTQTVPPGRVQALQIRQPVLWRPFGWFRVLVVVAGYGSAEKRSVLLPVGRREDVMAVTAAMFPDLKVEDPEEVFDAGLTGQGESRGFTEVPRNARIFDPIVRRRRGFRTTPSTLLFRDGRVSRNLTLVAHERIQSLSLHQGPFQRRAQIADIRIHSPSGPFRAQLKNQQLDAAKALFEQESAYAAVARRFSDRNQWMLPEELHEFEQQVAEAVEKEEVPVSAGTGGTDPDAEAHGARAEGEEPR